MLLMCGVAQADMSAPLFDSTTISRIIEKRYNIDPINAPEVAACYLQMLNYTTNFEEMPFRKARLA